MRGDKRVISAAIPLRGVGVDKGGVVEAGLALDTRLAHGVAFGIVGADDLRAFCKVQVDARLEEQRACPVRSGRQRQRTATSGGKRINSRLQFGRLLRVRLGAECNRYRRPCGIAEGGDMDYGHSNSCNQRNMSIEPMSKSTRQRQRLPPIVRTLSFHFDASTPSGSVSSIGV